MPDPLLALLGCFFFILSFISRSYFSFAFIERPLAISFLWGLCTGDMQTSVLVGLCCELFWLDLFPIGSYLPPNPILPMLVLFSIAPVHGWNSLSLMAFPLAMLLPVAYLTTFAEKRIRQSAAMEHSYLLAAVPSGNMSDKTISWCIRKGFVKQIIVGIILFAAVLLVAMPIMSLLNKPLTIARAYFDFSESAIICVSALGAFLALRIPKAYLVFIVFMAALLMLYFI